MVAQRESARAAIRQAVPGNRWARITLGPDSCCIVLGCRVFRGPAAGRARTGRRTPAQSPGRRERLLGVARVLVADPARACRAAGRIVLSARPMRDLACRARPLNN